MADLIPHGAAPQARPQRFVPVKRIVQGVASIPRWGAEQLTRELRELDDAVDDQDVDRWAAGG